MARWNIALGIALVLPALVPACAPLRAGPFDLPDPEIYARAEDRERARLILAPCTPADEGRGCERRNGELTRKTPCTVRAKDGVSQSLPTDQCYRMDAPRRYRGVWIDEFEGQRFIPEGTTPPEWPEGDPTAPGWREASEQARLARIWLDMERVERPRPPRDGSGRYSIEFSGRQTLFPGAYGHFGMPGHKIIVDEVIALRKCPAKGPCG